jgi:hypothetical protein
MNDTERPGPPSLDLVRCTQGANHTLVLTLVREDKIEFTCTVDARMAHSISDDLLRHSARARVPRDGESLSG